MRQTISRPLIALTAILLATGCVSQKKMQTYVDGQMTTVENRIDGVESQVEANQTRLDEQARVQEEQQEALAALSDTTRQALERAVAAGKLAEGKLLYETVLTEDSVRFGFESSDLDDLGKEALDSFAEQLKTDGEGVYVEIQGHTDDSGPDRFNFELGQQRAEVVQRYLHLHHSLPLHRMSAISYGESAPQVANDSREGRSQNRRVVLVVLR